MDTNNKKYLYTYGGEPVYGDVFEANKFPFETVYPKVIVNLIQELHDKVGFPIEFSAVSLLVAFATAIGSTIRLQFKKGFTVMANLYCVLVGDPGTCKTHPIRFMFTPIEDRQALYYKEYAEKMEEYTVFEKMSKTDKKGLPPVKKPKLRINTLDNYTLETLLKRLNENPRGVSVIVDELNGFFENMNRYNSGSDGETYNSLWSGVPTSVNRVTSDPFYVLPTAVSIFGTIQPAILEKMFAKDKDKNGLAARFIFSMPDGLLPLKWDDKEVDDALVKTYQDAIQKLLDVELSINEQGEPMPTIIKLTEEAFDRILEWHNGNEYYNKILEEKGNTYFEAFVKLDTYALRFALILQMIYASVDNESKDEIGIRAVENAILLVDYFMREAVKVHGLVYKKDIRSRMTEKQREVYEIMPPAFYLSQMRDKVAALGFSKDQLKKFLGIEDYFERIERGKYKKKFVEVTD
ncbi:MAG: DUF3987 domain-containing protein [Candidatus Symbiothrix sp.]|jgi:hypothetical protein|nr:DUF3987 domain-containing protein [Candidatus Symbiothrix sp.]